MVLERPRRLLAVALMAALVAPTSVVQADGGPATDDLSANRIEAGEPKHWNPFVVPPDLVTLPGVPCFSSKPTSPWVKVIYLFQKGTPGQLKARTNMIREAIGIADLIYSRSAERTGGIRHVRWRMTSSCQLMIVPVAIDLSLSIDRARELLITKKLLAPTEKGLAFREGVGPLAGLGERFTDSRPLSTNRNNRGGTLGWVYLDFFDFLAADELTAQGHRYVEMGQAAAHELAHTLGAVQPDAPHSTGAHCWDMSDLMCAKDRPGDVLRQVCPPTIPLLLDCRGDDFFNTNPKAGTYLAKHWNIAGSRFLATRSTSRWDALPRASVQLLDVAEGDAVAFGADVDVDATPASDGATVVAVSLVIDERIVDIDRETPFTVSFYSGVDLPAGTPVDLRAVGYDSLGRQATTAPIRVMTGTVGPPI